MTVFKTSTIKTNTPPKVLKGNITSVTDEDKWNYPNGTDDPWWENGSQPRFFTWRYDIDITERQHGSHLTREKFLYNGYDVTVGDYIASPTGEVLKIIEVEYKSPSNVELVGEDYIRYNTFNSSSGVGRLDEGPCVIFEVNENVEPLFSALPSDFAFTSFYSKVDSYFKYLNPVNNFLLYKPSHNFEIGDIISIEPNGDFVLSNSNNSNRVIGNVVQTMGTEWFMVNPVNEIFDYRPALPGEAGDFLYADSNGSVTTQKTGKLLFIKLLNAIKTETKSNNPNPPLNSGDELIIDDNTIVIGNDLESIATEINQINSQLYLSEVVGAPNSIETSTNTLNYGLVGGFIPFSATINGVTVEVINNPSGSQRFGGGIADEIDINNAINAAFSNSDDISSELKGGDIVLRTEKGNAINIINQQNDANSIPFAGSNSITGFTLNTAESTDKLIRIEKLDGSVLSFENGNNNTTSDLVSDLGLYDIHNGRYPIVLYVEQGMRKGDVYVADDLTQRDNLNVLIGDSAYVMDTGNGEWSYWLFTNSGWTLIATEDSARTDADTLMLELDHNASQGAYLIGTVSDNSSISNITIEVTESFDDENASLNVGDGVDNSRLIDNNIIDLTFTSNYVNNPSHVYSGGDTDLNAYFNPASSTQGALRIVITYA